MNLKHLLLVLTVGLWFVVGSIAWPIRPYMTSGFVAYCCRLAAWTASAQLAAMLIPLVGKWSTQTRFVVGLLVGVGLVSYWFQSLPAGAVDAVIQFGMYQAVVLLPLTIVARYLGLRLTLAAVGSCAAASKRQFSLLALLVWTAAAAAYFWLIRNLAPEFLPQIFVMVCFVALPVCLGLLCVWATLGQRGLLWRSAVLVAVVIASANVSVAIDDSRTFSAWEFAIVFASPALLVWLTCLTLRAFGWRLTARQAQPLPPAAATVAAENA